MPFAPAARGRYRLRILAGDMCGKFRRRLAGAVRGWLRQTRAFTWGQRYVTGSVYIALGAVAALAGAGAEK